MKYSAPIFLILILFNSLNLYSSVEFKKDNGNLAGFYSNLVNYEESVILRPPFPAKLEKIKIYLGGQVPAKDTIWIHNDPTDGLYPPSFYSRHLSTLCTLIIDYDGQAGWKEFDVSQHNILFGGVNGITIQHLIKKNGPFFGNDKGTQSAASYTSLLNDVFTPNPKFYNIRGSKYSLTKGYFMVRAIINYLNSDKEGNYIPNRENKLIDVTTKAGLVANNSLLKSEMATVVDFNNDGWDDIVIKNYFFKNNKDKTFENVSSLINAPNNGTVWADIDNDGYIDFIAVNGFTNDRLYFGNSDGTFTEETDDVLKVNAPTVSPLWLDYDQDGLVDLYIAYGRTESGGKEVYFQDKLFKNLGNRKFKEVTVEAGIAAGEPVGLDCWGATTTDYNNDGLTDIFVATYRLAPDLLYRNNGDGTFTEVGKSTGARGVPTANANYFGHGMGADWGDYDNDGYLDLAVGNLSHVDERALSSNKSLILKNTGNSEYKFIDKTDSLRLGFFEMNAGIMWGDLNLDGYLDLVHSQYSYQNKGQEKDKNTRFYLNSGKENNYILKDMTYDFGAFIHGAWSPVRIDYDNDGDIDILVASDKENVKLFENQTRKLGNWISFKLIGSSQKGINMSAYGSSVTVYSNDKKFYRSLSGSQLNSRASQSSNELYFGLGMNEIDSVVITNNSNSKQTKLTFNNLIKNRKYIIDFDGNITELNQWITQLIYPPNDFVTASKSVELTRLDMVNADEYLVQIATDSLMQNIIYSKNVTTNKLSFEESKHTDMWWRVIVIKDQIEQSPSDIWHFRLNDMSAIDSDYDKNDEIFDVYPNPSNNILQLNLERSSNNSYLEIIDLNGKVYYNNHIKKISSNNIMTIDISNLQSGTYIINLKDNLNIKSKLFTVIR